MFAVWKQCRLLQPGLLTLLMLYFVFYIYWVFDFAFFMYFTILTLTQVSSIRPARHFSEGWSNRAKVKTFCLSLANRTKTNPAETFRGWHMLFEWFFFFFFANSSLAIKLINYVALKMFIWSFSSPFISGQFGRDWTIYFTTENFLFLIFTTPKQKKPKENSSLKVLFTFFL